MLEKYNKGENYNNEDKETIDRLKDEYPDAFEEEAKYSLEDNLK